MVGIDTNILLYAYDKGSPLHEEAKALIRSMLGEDGIAISDLSLLEFFSVATDGRKMTSPLSAEEALKVIETIWRAEEFLVCCGKAEVMRKTFLCTAELNILRYGVNDVYIAMSLAESGFHRILTRNTRDFNKFDFIQAINPFRHSAMPSAPCASRMIPYARQSIDEQDVAAVCSVLRSDWLTTGPKVGEFEETVADYVGAKHAVAVSSGTAALHGAMFALEIGPGDEVIVPPMTFAATANCVVYQGGTPVFADVDLNTLLLDPKQVEAKITPNTKAIIGVDFAGQPCDWDALREIADSYNLHLVDDGCHALGAEYKGKKVGTLANLTVFSFHPVKHIATGEGGMVVTDNPNFAERMRIFRSHGITRDPSSFVNQPSAISHQPVYPPWYYEMMDLGYNYRITDFQCALGISQLQKLLKFLERRREIAALYDEALATMPGIEPLGLRADVLPTSQSAKGRAQSEGKEGAPSDSTPCSMRHVNPVEFTGGDSVAHSTGAPCSLPSLHVYHLYVVKIDFKTLGTDRATLFTNFREKEIAVNVHYIPVFLHPFYRDKFNTRPGLCPNAEYAYEQIISLPMFPGMSDMDVDRVINVVKKAVGQT